MKSKKKLILTAICSCFYLFNSPVLAASKDTLQASSLYPFGRYIQDRHGNLELISSAVHFGFRFTGSYCTVYASIFNPADHNYLQYTVDGVYHKRVKITGKGAQQINIQVTGNGAHTIWIYKATEAQTGPIFIEKIYGRGITALKNADLPLIEFIGNSITCGAASDPSEVPCGVGEYHDQHNAYYAYGPRLARLLHVNFMLSSVSGIGIYRNWNSLSPTMPQVYKKSDFEENGTRNWDFKKYSPRIVSIALGTNDFSDGDHVHSRLPFDSTRFVDNYIGFVQQVKSKYPKARIALLSSPMLNGEKRALLQHCLSAVKIKKQIVIIRKIRQLLYSFLSPCRPGDVEVIPAWKIMQSWQTNSARFSKAFCKWKINRKIRQFFS